MLLTCQIHEPRISRLHFWSTFQAFSGAHKWLSPDHNQWRAVCVSQGTSATKETPSPSQQDTRTELRSRSDHHFFTWLVWFWKGCVHFFACVRTQSRFGAHLKRSVWWEFVIFLFRSSLLDSPSRHLSRVLEGTKRQVLKRRKKI